MELAAHKVWGRLRFYAFTYALPLSNVFGATEVREGLYVGDIWSAFQGKALAEHGITHVVCMLPGVPPIHPHLSYLQLPSLDDASFDISYHFPQAIRFMDAAHAAGGKVLVHCSCGVSRSSTIAILHTCHVTKEDPDTVLCQFVQKRPVILPNHGFMMHLRNWYLTWQIGQAVWSTE
jgi:hypothetical protein